MSAPQRSAQRSFSTSSSVPLETGDAPMLALILVRLARPMPSGRAGSARWTLLAGMIIRPGGDLVAHLLGREVRLALGDAPHLRRDDAEPRVLELRHRHEALGRRASCRRRSRVQSRGKKSQAVLSRRRRHAGRVGRAEGPAAPPSAGARAKLPGFVPCARRGRVARRAAEARRGGSWTLLQVATDGSRERRGRRASPEPSLRSHERDQVRRVSSQGRASWRRATPRLRRERGYARALVALQAPLPSRRHADRPRQAGAALLVVRSRGPRATATSSPSTRTRRSRRRTSRRSSPARSASAGRRRARTAIAPGMPPPPGGAPGACAGARGRSGRRRSAGRCALGARARGARADAARCFPDRAHRRRRARRTAVKRIPGAALPARVRDRPRTTA